MSIQATAQPCSLSTRLAGLCVCVCVCVFCRGGQPKLMFMCVGACQYEPKVGSAMFFKHKASMYVCARARMCVCVCVCLWSLIFACCVCIWSPNLCLCV